MGEIPEAMVEGVVMEFIEALNNPRDLEETARAALEAAGVAELLEALQEAEPLLRVSATAYRISSGNDALRASVEAQIETHNKVCAAIAKAEGRADE